MLRHFRYPFWDVIAYWGEGIHSGKNYNVGRKIKVILIII